MHYKGKLKTYKYVCEVSKMNKIIRKNKFNTEEYVGRNMDALRWARRYGTWGNNEHVLIFDKNEHLISEAIYSEEMKSYYKVSV